MMVNIQEHIEGADLSQVVETVRPKTKPAGEIVEAPQLKEPQYHDPIDDSYKIEMQNRTGLRHDREEPEAVKMRHRALHAIA